MWVTAYTDASYSNAHGGAWAVWLTSARGRIVRRGRCPDYVQDATAAELAAVYAAVYIACRAWPDVRGLTLRSDSRAALAASDPTTRRPRNAAMRRLRSRLCGLLTRHAMARRTDALLRTIGLTVSRAI